jgi:hypothetical protein
LRKTAYDVALIPKQTNLNDQLKTTFTHVLEDQTRQILDNFKLQNMILTYTKDFSRKKIVQICQISNFKNSKSPESCDNFQRVPKNIKRFCYFGLSSYLLCNQIWLNYFLDDRHFGYITKSLKAVLLHSKQSSKTKSLHFQTCTMMRYSIIQTEDSNSAWF